MFKTIIATALLAATLPAAAPAEQVTRQVHVSYSDLDLSRAADVRLFDKRLGRALATVCPYMAPDDKWTAAEVARCRKAARAGLADQRAAALAAATRTQLATTALR